MSLRAAALSLVLAAAAPTLAEEAPPPPATPPVGPSESANSTRVGLGVGVGDGSSVEFSVPIQIGRSFRLEPELSLLNVGTSGPGWVGDAHAVKAGLGLAWTLPIADQVQASIGMRFQVTMVGYSHSGSTPTGSRAALVAGGEWLPVPRVSLGVEAQVGYTYSTDSQGGLGMVPPTGVDTAGLLIARVYIW